MSIANLYRSHWQHDALANNTTDASVGYLGAAAGSLGVCSGRLTLRSRDLKAQIGGAVGLLNNAKLRSFVLLGLPRRTSWSPWRKQGHTSRPYAAKGISALA